MGILTKFAVFYRIAFVCLSVCLDVDPLIMENGDSYGCAVFCKRFSHVSSTTYRGSEYRNIGKNIGKYRIIGKENCKYRNIGNVIQNDESLILRVIYAIV